MESTRKQTLFYFVLAFLSSQTASAAVVQKGGSVVLSCGNLPKAIGDVSWCKITENGACDDVITTIAGQVLKVYSPWDGSDINMTSNPSELHILSASYPRDQGTFKCLGGGTEQGVNVTVVVPPEKVSIHGATIPLPENTITTWTCEAKGGIPDPQITWEIGLPKVSLKKEKVLDTVTSSVSFVVSRTMDVIRCRATQLQYSVIREIVLDILYKPIASIEVSPAQYSLGSQVTLVCLAEGNPKPEILWMFNGKVLEQKDNNLDHKLGRYKDAVKTKSNEPSRGSPKNGSWKGNDSPLHSMRAHRLDDGSNIRQRRGLLGKFTTAIVQASKETWYKVFIRDKQKRDLSEQFGDISGKSVSRNAHIISSLNTSNNGRYTCAARNSQGEGMRSVTLKLKSPLEILLLSLLPYLLPVLIGLILLFLAGVSIACIRKRCKGHVKPRPKTEPKAETIEMAEIPNIDDVEINPNQNEQTVEETDGQESAMTQPTMPSVPQIVISVHVHMQGEQSEQIIQEIDDESGSYLHPVHRPRARGPYESLGAANANKLDHPSFQLLPHRLCQSNIDLIDKSSQDYPIPGDDTPREGGDRGSDPYETLFRLGQKRYTY